MQDRKYKTGKFAEELAVRLKTDAGTSKEVRDYERLYLDAVIGTRRGEMKFTCMKEFMGSTTSMTDRGIAPLVALNLNFWCCLLPWRPLLLLLPPRRSVRCSFGR